MRKSISLHKGFEFRMNLTILLAVLHSVMGSTSPPISTVGFLTRETELFLARFDHWFPTLSQEDASNLKRAIRRKVTNEVLSDQPDIALHRIAQFFSAVRRGWKSTNLLAISVGTGWDLSDELERSKPGSLRIVNFAKRLGMSYTETRSMVTRLLDELGVEDMQRRISDMESRVSEFVETNPTRTSTPLSLLEALVPSSIHDRFLEYSSGLSLPQLHQFIARIFSAALPNVSSDFEEARGLLVEVFKYFSVFSSENSDVFDEQMGRVRDFIVAVAEAEGEQDILRETRAVLPELSRMVGELKNFGEESMSEIKEVMMSEICDSFPQESEARVVLMPKIIELIETVCLVPQLGEDSRRFVHLVQAIAEISVRLVRERNTCLIRLSNFLDSFRNSLRRGMRNENSQLVVIQTAFEISNTLGVPLLREYPHLLETWPEERILAVRKIIGSFLWFDGPTEWDMNKTALSSALAGASQSQLDQAIPVLVRMHKKGFNLIEKAPLVSPASWLIDWLKEPAATPYATFVKGYLLPSPFPSGKWEKLARLPDNVESVIASNFEFPPRLVRLSDQANNLMRQYAGLIPDYLLLRLAADLPRELFKLEINLGMLHKTADWPIVNLVERSVAIFLDLAETVGANSIGTERIDLPNLESARMCAISFDHIGDIFLTANVALDQNIDAVLVDAFELFIHEMRLLTNAIQDNHVVPFVVNAADRRHFCQFPRYNP